jgi:hypothetical protein
MYSKSLKLNFALHKDSGWVYFEDGVRYSPEEIRIINADGIGEINPSVHSAKKVFKTDDLHLTEIVKYEGKRDGKNNTVNSDTSGKIPPIIEHSPKAEQRELGIF